MPCFSSGLPALKPRHVLLDDEERGPSGVWARTVRKSA